MKKGPAGAGKHFIRRFDRKERQLKMTFQQKGPFLAGLSFFLRRRVNETAFGCCTHILS
jgi:hypothetical protein